VVAVADVVVTACVADGAVWARHACDTSGSTCVWARGAERLPDLTTGVVAVCGVLFRCADACDFCGTTPAGAAAW